MFFSSDLIQELPFLNQLLIIIINAVGFSLVVTFLNHNSLRNRLSLIFLGLSLSIFGWVDFAYLARLAGPNQIEAAEFFLRIAWVATPFVFMFAYIMSTLIVGASKKFRLTTISVIIVSIIFGLITGVTDLVVAGISFVNQNVDIQYGVGFLPFLGVVGVIMAVTIWPILSVHEANMEERKGIRGFFFGIIIFYIANLIFNITLPFFFKITHLYYFGDYSTMVLLGSIVYAILRHRLFNVKYIATELFIFSLWMFIFLRTLVISNFRDQMTSAGLLVISIILGIFVMRSVLREVKTREQLEGILHFMSHEVKGALGKTRGLLSFVSDGTLGEVSPKLREMAGDLSLTVSESLDSVEDILNSANIKKGTFTYQMAPFDFTALVTKLVNVYKPQAEHKNLLFTYKTPATAVSITGDEKHLEHVVKNLIDNAVRYTKEGGVTVSVTVNPKTVILSVADTGYGLTEEDKKNLFTEGGKGKESQKVNVESTGYGLFIAKSIALAHSGKIWAESAGREKGSTFFVELPLNPPDLNSAKKDKNKVEPPTMTSVEAPKKEISNNQQALPSLLIPPLPPATQTENTAIVKSIS
jgi:signal transduction histidine kinase